jgi:hypothetical protein
MLPRRIPCWPATARSSEVLPTPLRPITQATSPIAAAQPTPRSAWLAP